MICFSPSSTLPSTDAIFVISFFSKNCLDSSRFFAIKAIDPSKRGAADISFVAPHIQAALDGLGVVGSGSHSEEETIDLNSLPIMTKRAAVLIYRLIYK